MSAAKKATKMANINVSLYDDVLDIGYDCVGVDFCRFALCHTMPPDGSEECTYREYGACRRTSAQYTALKSLQSRLAKHLKEFDEE